MAGSCACAVYEGKVSSGLGTAVAHAVKACALDFRAAYVQRLCCRAADVHCYSLLRKPEMDPWFAKIPKVCLHLFYSNVAVIKALLCAVGRQRAVQRGGLRQNERSFICPSAFLPPPLRRGSRGCCTSRCNLCSCTGSSRVAFSPCSSCFLRSGRLRSRPNLHAPVRQKKHSASCNV